MGAFHYPRFLITVILAAFVLALSLLSLPVLAQSGCTGDPCVFYTPTPTVTGTPSPTPGSGTPTAVPMPATVIFPIPDYSQPTSIPVLSLPTANPNGYTPPTIVLPSPLAISYTPPAFSTPSLGVVTSTPLISINTSLELSYDTPLGISTPGITGTDSYTDVDVSLIGVSGLVSDVVSYTTWLSTTAANINPTETFTIATAPDWYAPPLPRPLADVGWTFETMQTGIDEGRRYSMAAWAGFFGYVASLPFQFLKVLYQIVQFLGPLGLFITWLLLMAPLVTYFRILLFFKNLFISLLNFIIKVIGFLLDLAMSLVKLVVGFFA